MSHIPRKGVLSLGITAQWPVVLEMETEARRQSDLTQAPQSRQQTKEPSEEGLHPEQGLQLGKVGGRRGKFPRDRIRISLRSEASLRVRGRSGTGWRVSLPLACCQRAVCMDVLHHVGNGGLPRLLDTPACAIQTHTCTPQLQAPTYRAQGMLGHGELLGH